ncbi:MAG: mechanosensitive ion channel family protein [Desulfovibrionaceae bacterium]
MNDWEHLDPARLWARFVAWADAQIFTLSALAEVGVLAACLALGWLAWRRLRPGFDARHPGIPSGTDYVSTFLRAVRRVAWLGLAWPPLLVGMLILKGLGRPHYLLDAGLSLAGAWVVIRLMATLIRHRFWARLLAVVIWTAVALHVFKLLEPTAAILDRIGLDLGGARISLLVLVKGSLVAVVLLQAAAVLSRFLDRRIGAAGDLSPSVRVLLTKGVSVGLYALAGLLVLGAVGVNLSSLAFLTGAVGVGVGFGLQKIFSNFVSGVILLLDKSIKPGDVIETAGVFGQVTSLSARYASVQTRDGKVFLIPNENLIANEVVNWSHNDANVRVKIPVGVGYGSDLRLVERLLLEAAKGHPRVLASPPPMVRLMGFGESSVDFEIRVWVDDPMDGLVSLSSDILLVVWDRFHERDIEIPFPQRDVHIKSWPAGGPGGGPDGGAKGGSEGGSDGDPEATA